MRTRVRSDDVPAPVQFANLFAVQKARCVDVIGSDVKVPPPAEVLQHRRDFGDRARSAVVEGEQASLPPSAAPFQDLLHVARPPRSPVSHHFVLDRFQVVAKRYGVELIAGRLVPGKSARTKGGAGNHIVITERGHFHGVLNVPARTRPLFSAPAYTTPLRRFGHISSPADRPKQPRWLITSGPPSLGLSDRRVRILKHGDEKINLSSYYSTICDCHRRQRIRWRK